MTNLLTILAAALLSGLLATWVSIWYQKRSESRQVKLRVLQQLLGSRGAAATIPSSHQQADDFEQALNQISVVFHDSPTVVQALGRYWEATVGAQNDLTLRRLVELFKAMYKDLGIPSDSLGDDFFLRPFRLQNRGH